MVLSIKDPETDRLARELAKHTGETITQAVAKAIQERFKRVEAERRPLARGYSLSDELLEIGRRCAALPRLDTRTSDEIIGYDENGLPR